MERIFFFKQRSYEKITNSFQKKKTVINGIINKKANKQKMRKTLKTFWSKFTIKTYKKFTQKKLVVIDYSNIKEEQTIFFEKFGVFENELKDKYNH